MLDRNTSNKKTSNQNKLRHRSLKSQKGQSLIEYLILVALMAIASIGIVKVLGQNLQGQFARVTHALKGESAKPRLRNVNKSYYKQKDLGDFFDGAANNDK